MKPLAPDFLSDPRTHERWHLGVVDATWRGELPGHWPQAIAAPAFLGSDTARCPALVDLKALPAAECAEWVDDVRQHLVEGEDCALSMVLATGSSDMQIAAHLAQRMVIQAPGSDRPMQWRFFDPGTFLQLPDILGDAGMAWLLGPVDAVLVPWAGHWTEFVRPGHAPPFRLGAGHLQALIRIGIVNRVVSQTLQPKDAADWIERCRVVHQHAIRGQKHGLVKQVDLVAFASNALNCHPRFDSHPRIHRLLDELRHAAPEDELDYRELSARIAPREWQAIARDLDANTNMLH